MLPEILNELRGFVIPHFTVTGIAFLQDLFSTLHTFFKKSAKSALYCQDFFFTFFPFLLYNQAKRQQRKLNFLITQTELYAHFVSRKRESGPDEIQEAILRKLEDHSIPRQAGGSSLSNVQEDYGRQILHYQHNMTVTITFIILPKLIKYHYDSH